tara:strand:- start:782 stop:1015 length:234 start_codon:yes stop_codon:yes gene_type:complete
MRISPTNTIKVDPIAPIGEKKMKQYWMKIEYQYPVDSDNPLWILTQGTFRNATQVWQSYQYQAEAMNYKILEVKERE